MTGLTLIIILFLLAGAIPAHGGGELAIFSTPLFWTLSAAMAGSCVWCCRRHWQSLRGMFFTCAHIGLALILLGAAIGLFGGRKTQFAAYIGAAPENVLPGPDDTTYSLDFSIAVTDFTVDYYAPSYSLYAPPEKEGGDFTLVKTLKPTMEGKLFMPDGSPLPMETLKDEDGQWKAQVFLEDGRLLHMSARTPKAFSATARIERPGGATEEKFSVNHPLCVDGWRFYLMSHDQQRNEYITMTARRDPGRLWVVAGIWLLIVGVAGLCWRRPNSLLMQWQKTEMHFMGGCSSAAVIQGIVLTLALAIGSMHYIRRTAGEGVVMVVALSVLGYAVTLVLALLRKRLAVIVFVAAWCINLMVVIGNYALCGHPPFGNMYHVLIFLALSFGVIYLILSYMLPSHPLNLLPYFAFAALLPLVGTFFMSRNLAWQRVPALQSPWFVPHVLSYMVSYATATIAFLLMVASLLTKDAEQRETRHQIAHHILRFAMPLMTFGLWSGALWAEEAWGIYWSWDPKETWALVTWLLYLVSLHCYFEKQPRRAVWTHIAGFVALLTTFLVVNLLPKFGSALHSYVK